MIANSSSVIIASPPPECSLTSAIRKFLFQEAIPQFSDVQHRTSIDADRLHAPKMGPLTILHLREYPVTRLEHIFHRRHADTSVALEPQILFAACTHADGLDLIGDIHAKV